MRWTLPAFSDLAAQGTSWSLAHPWITLASTGVLLVLSLTFASFLEVDPSPEAYLKGTPEWRSYERFGETFGFGETVVVALRESGGTVFDAETVQTVAELDRIISHLPGVRRVLSIASATMLGKPSDETNADVIDVSRLLPAGAITNATAVELGSRISRHLVYQRLLTDERHETTFLFAQIDPKAVDPVHRLVLTREIRKEADRFHSKTRTVHLGGTPVTKEAIASGIQQDLVLFFPVALLLMAVLLWIMFGDPVASLIPLGVVGFSSIVVLGLLGVLRIPLNMATATVPTMILAVGLADGVHFFSELRRQFGRTKNRELALVATVETIALPCLFTSTTSAAGFCALLFSRVGPLREFGYSAALGLLVTYAASMLLMPVLLATFQYPRHRSQGVMGTPRMASFLTRLAIRGGRHLIVPVSAVGLLTGACIATLSHLNVNSDFLAYFEPEHRLRKDLAVIESSFGGADQIEVILVADRPEAFLEPKSLELIDRLEKALQKLDGVGHAFSFADYMKLANRAMAGGDGGDADFPLPQTKEAIAQLLLVNGDAFKALASTDLAQARLTVQIPTRSSEEIRALAERISETGRAVFAGTGVTVVVTGLPPLFASIVRDLVADAAGSFGLAALMMWVAMMIGFRSVGLAAAAIVPNVLPVGLTFATMVVLGMSYDPNSAFVACLGIGISVDNAVHIASRYQRARAFGAPTTSKAVQYALTHAGQPVLFTAILFGVAFLVLCLSSFNPTMKVGVLSTFLVFYAVVCDLVILPVLLIGADRIGATFAPEEKTMPSEISGRFRDASSTLTSDPAPANVEPEEETEIDESRVRE